MTETFYIIGILWSLDCALRIQNQAKKELPDKFHKKWVIVKQFF
jgi:hypothetical protein